MSATVIIPTTGSKDVLKAIESVLNQTYEDTTCYLVIDGKENADKVCDLLDGYLHEEVKISRFLKISTLPINVGANGFYGHRIYAAFTHLVNSKYVLYLDQDNWMDKDHITECVYQIEERDLHWSYSLRKICDVDGNFVCQDNCESLGKWPVFSGDYKHVDTNCYCIKTEVATKVASIWHGGWGQDRAFFNVLSSAFNKFECTGRHTLNYRLGGNEGSVKPEFFLYGNDVMMKRYNGGYPWLIAI